MRKSTKICAALGVVAGLGVAVAPLSVFADTPTRTDTLNVSVSQACTVNGKGLSATEVVANRYDAAIDPGQIVDFNLVDGSGATTTTENKFTINCNVASGYSVYGTGQALSRSDGIDTTIPTGVPTAGTSAWGAMITPSGNLTTTYTTYKGIGNNVVVASNDGGSADAGDSFSVAYKVSAAYGLETGEYSGQVTYTVVAGN